MQNHLAAIGFGATRWLTQLGGIVLIGTALASPAAAVPIVYTMQGTLASGGADPLSLNGARLVIAAIADTEVGPISTASSGGRLVTATYQPQFDVAAIFSNRPGGAPDVVVAYAALLQSQNHFPPGTVRDNFRLFPAAAIFEGTAVTMPEFSVFFFGQAYFPGSGVPPLPLFAPTDVETVAAGFLGSSGVSYLISDRSFTAVPEPATALCVALGLSVLGVVRRR